MKIKSIIFKTFDKIVERVKIEGIVLLGAGGNLQEWVSGITDCLHEEGIAISNDSSQLWRKAYSLCTSGGRTDLVLVLNEESTIDMGKLAAWRLRFGDASWVSDYVVSYADQHRKKRYEL